MLRAIDIGFIKENEGKVYAYIAENGLVGHLFILHSPFSGMNSRTGKRKVKKMRSEKGFVEEQHFILFSFHR
jgi:hypothetical protein